MKRSTEPLLFRYKQGCCSPSRAGVQMKDEFRYDEDIQMAVTLEDGRWVPVIEMQDDPKKPKPITKKADIEKGDDQKDERRWR